MGIFDPKVTFLTPKPRKTPSFFRDLGVKMSLLGSKIPPKIPTFCPKKGANFGVFGLRTGF